MADSWGVVRATEGGLGAVGLRVTLSIGVVPIRLLDELEHASVLAITAPSPIDRCADMLIEMARLAVGGSWAPASSEDAVDLLGRMNLDDLAALPVAAGVFAEIPTVILAGAMVEIERRSSSARMVGATVGGGRRHTRGGRWK